MHPVYTGEPYIFFMIWFRAVIFGNMIFVIKLVLILVKTWLPETDEGERTGLLGGYPDCRPWGYPASLRAIVYDDKIYLFYWKDHHIYYAIFDGKTWTEKGVVFNANYHPFYNVEVVIKNGKPVICFGGIPHVFDNHFWISYLTGEINIEEGPKVYLDYVQWNNHFSIAHGSVKSGMQANMIQIFGNNSNWVVDQLRRCEVNIDTGQISSWSDTGFDNAGGKRSFVPCEVVTAALALPNDPRNLRHFLVVFAKGPTTQDSPYAPANYRNYVSSYESDYFECSYQSDRLYTGDEATLEPNSWVLLGVVEGVPPFTRNGQENPNTSFVKYGQSTEKSISITHNFETSISSTIGISLKESFDVSAKLGLTFGVSNDMVTKLVKSITVNLNNTQDNQEGDYGWLIISKPYLRNRIYKRKTQNGSAELGTFNVIKVEDVGVTFEPYKLEAPPAGMYVRKKSSDLLSWKDNNFPIYDKISLLVTDPIVADTRGGSVEPYW